MHTTTQTKDGPVRRSLRRLVGLSGPACFAAMIVGIWLVCGIVACATGDASVMGEASITTLLAGIGYCLLH